MPTSPTIASSRSSSPETSSRPATATGSIATGFCRCGPREVVGGNVIPEVKRQSELSEITGTVGSVFLGLTIGCARCHDHKYDAIPTTDYYRLQSFFAASELEDVPIASEAERAAFKAAEKAIARPDRTATAATRQARGPLSRGDQGPQAGDARRGRAGGDEHAGLEADGRPETPGAGTCRRRSASRGRKSPRPSRPIRDVHRRREDLKRAIYEIERTLPRPPARRHGPGRSQGEGGTETFVLRRGDYKNRGPRVAPRPPGVILAAQKGRAFTEESIVPAGDKTGRRGALSRWLTRADNPLTARVIVNRLWQHHFGRGIVASRSDFGVRGEPPSHPELLDWLASRADRRRLAAQADSSPDGDLGRLSPVEPDRIGELAADDPENMMLSRMNRRRLDAEGVRDAMLAVSGELNTRAGGPGVLAPIEKEVEDLIFTEAEVVDLWPEDRNPAEHLRRSLYLFRKRNVRYPLFDSFDAPDTQTACPRRETSTHALQALNLLNSDFAIGTSQIVGPAGARGWWR